MTPSLFLRHVAMDMRVFKSASRISLLLYRVIISLCLYVTWIGADLPLQDVRGPQEICKDSTFAPECNPNQVIVLTQAHFGRMKIGKCIKRDFGYVGCSADVLGVLEPVCSGRPSCSVDSQNSDFPPACPVDLTSYLEASYGCLPVTTAGGICRSSPARLSTRSGYLSSHISIETGQGSSRCPWVIPLNQGQVVNVTLYNFLTLSSPAAKLHPNACFNVLKVSQRGNEHHARLCTHDAREKNVIVSYDFDVELSFGDQSSIESVGQFVVHYTVGGCENPEVPENAYLQRQGNEAVISCNYTETSWKLSCGQDEKWSSLESMSCPTKPKNWSFLDIFEDLKTINPYVLLGVVAGGVALGVIVGGFCLFLAIRAFKRRHPLPPSAKKLRKLRELEYRQTYALQRMYSMKDGRTTPDGLATPSSTTGRRYHTCGRHPVPVQPRPNAPVSERPEHIYEIPNYEIEENSNSVSRA